MWLFPHLTYWNGGTKFVFEAIRELSKKHEISLFVQKSSPEISKRFKEIPINVRTLGNSSTGDIWFWLNFRRNLGKEITYLKNEAGKHDLVISSVFPTNIIGNAIGIPHIQYCFEPFAFFWDSFMIKKFPLPQRFFITFMKFLFGKKDIEATRKSKKVLTVNNGTREWISKVYGRDSIPTLLGVDTTIFKKIHDASLREKYRNKKIIIHSTDWTPLKRTNWLIRHFDKISSKINNVMLLITEVNTNGKERELAIKMIDKNKSKNIQLCGFIPIELLPNYYSLADVAVYTGIGKGASAASLFVLECMACETPVVRTSDTDEEIEHEKTGFLFDVDDSDSFIQYVLELLNNETLNLQFGKMAREFIEQKYSWKNVAQIFEKECLDLLNK